MDSKFIVFEGVEGSGKTTQLKATYNWLTEKISKESATAVIVTREPGGTDLGLELRQLLLHGENIQERAELFLYAADRAQHVEEFLKPKLAAGAIILCDRYTDSTVAYQGYGRGLNLELINQLNKLATNGLNSDLTIWLDVDVKIGLARTQRRGEADRIEKADLEFHQRVQKGYSELAKMHPDRIVRVDASGNELEVSQQIQNVLQAHFQLQP